MESGGRSHGMGFATGTRLGRYEIKSPLGAGGMGEVYLAEDTKLERTVALKVLPADVASDQQRMHRFVQEARAASSLNHPNIITIYEIEEIDSVNFIATEFIDGLTLRQRMAGAQNMKLADVLEIGIQAASALAAAHEAGIVHRDIKPENIMIRRDGIVKVLDFGLAKLTERSVSKTDPEAPTRALVNTGPGVVMGTVNYMSPEQARGLEVDARTDIWSLGVVLYEMVAGRAPFEGATPSDVIAKILEREPAPLARFTRDAPEALEWIVTKALAQDRDERYQTAREMLADLKKLRRRMELSAEIERSAAPDVSLSPQTSQSGVFAQPAISGASKQSVANTTTLQSAHATTSAEYIVTEIKRHRRAAFVALISLFIIGTLAFVWYKFAGNKKPVASPRAMKITRLTSHGQVGIPAISPDGKYVIYTLWQAGKGSLWLRQVSSNSAVPLVQPNDEETNYQGRTFSPSGEMIYYVITDKENPRGVLYEIPTLGGTPRRLLTDIASRITFAPDGKRFAFLRYDQNQGAALLMVAGLDGSGERVLATRKGNDWFQGDPAWSPDGKIIACGIGTDTGGSYLTMAAVPAEGGKDVPITSFKWRGYIVQASWLGDGSGLILTASAEPGGVSQIWSLSYPEGEAQQITNDVNGYNFVSLTADSTTLVTRQEDMTQRIWTIAQGEDAAHAKQLTSGKFDGQNGLAWTPDGKIVYQARTGDNSDLWIMNADGTGNKQLTTDASLEIHPVVTPDGRYIFFTSDRNGGLGHIWRMDIDGSHPRQMTEGSASDSAPRCSPDGQWVTFISWRSGKPLLWKIPAEGGEPTQVLDRPTGSAFFAPDGKTFFCTFTDDQVSPPKNLLALVSFESGQFIKVFDPPPTARAYGGFSADGRSYLYSSSRDGVDNVWSQPIDGGKAVQLTNFKSDLKSDYIYTFAPAHDGKRFALVRGFSNTDVILIKDFR